MKNIPVFVFGLVIILAGLKVYEMSLNHAYRMELLKTATVKADAVALPDFAMAKRKGR